MYRIMLLLLVTNVNYSRGQVDTRVAEASGRAVSEAAANQVQAAGIFHDDKGLLLRIACAESHFGTNPSTYRAGYHGGIWQVDSIGFAETKNTAAHPNLVARHAAVNSHFNIEWQELQWIDLRKPLFSALAARLVLDLVPSAIPPGLAEQAQYWKDHYNTNAGAGTTAHFIDAVTAHEAGSVNSDEDDTDDDTTTSPPTHAPENAGNRCGQDPGLLSLVLFMLLRRYVLHNVDMWFV